LCGVDRTNKFAKVTVEAACYHPIQPQLAPNRRIVFIVFIMFFDEYKQFFDLVESARDE
jgi:hypothetical protein